MRTAQIKIEGEPEDVARLAAALRQRFRVVKESPDLRMHREKSHLVRRWFTVVVVDELGEITPGPE